MAYVIGQKYFFGSGDDQGSATYAGEYNGQPVWTDDWGRLHVGDPQGGPEVVRSGSGFAPMRAGSAYGDQGVIDYWAKNPAPAGSSSIPGTPGYAPPPTRGISGETVTPLDVQQSGYNTAPTRSIGLVGPPQPLEDPNAPIDFGQGEFGGGLNRGTDPYEAFKAQFQKEYGRPITQEEMNSNEVLVRDLGISNELMTLLPVERVVGFDAKRLSLLDNNVLGALIGYDPRIVSNFGVDRLSTFDNGFIQSVIAPALAQANPVAAQELATATGGVVGGQAPTTRFPEYPNSGSQAPGVRPPVYPTPTTGTPPTGGTQPPIGQVGGPVPTAPSGPLTSRYQAPTVQGGADPLGIYTNTVNQTPYTPPTGANTGSRWSLFGVGDDDDLAKPTPATPTSGGSGVPGEYSWRESTLPSGARVTERWEPTTFDSRTGKPIAWGWKAYGSPEMPNQPRTGGQPSTSVMIGPGLLQDKTQADIDRINQQIITAQQNADLAARKQDFAEQKYYEQQAQQLQQQSRQLQLQAQQQQLNADLGYAGSRRADIGTQLNIEGQEFGQQRGMYQDRADAAWRAAQIALSQGNQAEAKRQFDLSYKLQELATQENLTQGAFNRNMQTQQFEMAQRRDPASFLDKVFAARGQAAPTGQPGAPAPTGQGYPSPLGASDILNSEYTPPGIRQVFGGGGRLGSTAGAPLPVGAPTGAAASFAPVSAQDWGDLSSPERQATLAGVQATGIDPGQWLQKSKQLTTGSFGRSTYAAPTR